MSRLFLRQAVHPRAPISYIRVLYGNSLINGKPSEGLNATSEHIRINKVYEDWLAVLEDLACGKGSDWYRYVIAFEGSITITGCRQGNLKDVTSGVVAMIAN